MPRYKNPTGRTIPVSAGNLSTEFQPGQERDTDEILDGFGLHEISEAPIWNPVVSNVAVAFAAAQRKEIACDVSRSNYVAVCQVEGCNVAVYLGAVSSSQLYARLRPGDACVVEALHRVRRIVLVSDAAGSCSVLQSSEPIELEG